MEEDLNENELEERFYSMRYKGNEAANLTTNLKDDNFVVRRPQTNIRRYWHTNDDHALQKVNRAKQPNLPSNEPLIPENVKSKGEKCNANPLPADLSMFQSPVPQFIKKSIEIIDNDGPMNIVELQSSDEDEVIEVKLPPKPTITIESSDEDEIAEVTNTTETNEKNVNKVTPDKKTTNRSDRDVSASPVPSIVSSVSDEFIRSDCIALNISSKHPNKQSFDFSLHGSDIIDQSSPPKRKKKKKNKDTATSTPITNAPTPATPVAKEGEYFATPKSKAKNKRQKTKNYSVSEKSIPNADVYDSDSNQSGNGIERTNTSYTFIDRSFPHADVYESDSNQSEKTSPVKTNQKPTEENICPSSDDNVSSENQTEADQTLESPQENNQTVEQCQPTIDLTETSFDDTNLIINENIVMANVTGFQEETDNTEHLNIIQNDATKFGSTKVPAILYEDLDFDNMKGKEKVCKKRRYSLSTLRAEMEKFYNESWGGENFNHREIQKNMSRDKSLWVIDPKDRMPGLSRRKPTCNYCNRTGHRDDTCRYKPPVCHMCGYTGHYETRCPRKICVNCGSPNHMYTTMCRNCSNWNNVRCPECGQTGHPASHCPDLWRRYHNTIACNTPLEENRQMKRHHQLFCSGCARRGHLIHTCRVSLPFSGLPINSPYVSLYNPIWSDKQNENTQQRNRPLIRYFTQDTPSSVESASNKNERNKRLSNSPVCHEGHMNKKRHMSNCEEVDTSRNTNSPMTSNVSGRKTPQNKDQCEDASKVVKDSSKVTNDNTEPPKTTNTLEKLDCITTSSSNHDKKGQMIQDNEVSDTSDVVTTARIYITNEIMEKLKTKEGEECLKKFTQSNNVTVQKSDSNTFISILGKVGDQEAFQSDLREWIQSLENSHKMKSNNEINHKDVENDPENILCMNMPRNRYNLLRKITRALDSLNEDLGDPKDIYKEFTYLQNHHQQLLKQKQISARQLSNNRDNLNDVIKKLNMILIGQAGLANGSKHLRKLRILKEKLTSFRQKYIPTNMRSEIGEHYHYVFTALPREDYHDLLNKYYTVKKKLVTFNKKKNDKSMKLGPAIVRKKLNRNYQKKNTKVEVNEAAEGKAKKSLDKTMNKLVFYHRRLMCTKPHDNVLDKARVELVNKLSSHISSLGQDCNKSPKSLKKMRKRIKVTQEQAQLFLTNV
ncbi:PREDICTED: uncharacterized protein LOC106124506 [Papilio xuthus]|uniref:Zinc finger CCHC domain-containing protein 7 n=1 Tax=Papilio xuthus TaxID=66420 RepID=A0AAJ6ZPA0_PAPXU|nr:PREDICTED: uncharacterized protein LOC106124506 [Papilio xuthus]